MSGNTCKRGAEYARTECTDPRRTLTTTLRCADGGVVAVKTEQPIPKDRLLEAMKQLNQMIVPLPVSIGDVLALDVDVYKRQILFMDSALQKYFLPDF